jgi:hypothetical protein
MGIAPVLSLEEADANEVDETLASDLAAISILFNPLPSLTTWARPCCAVFALFRYAALRAAGAEFLEIDGRYGRRIGRTETSGLNADNSRFGPHTSLSGNLDLSLLAIDGGRNAGPRCVRGAV